MSKPVALTDEEREIDAYGLLDLTADATAKDVQRAFRKMSLKYHPDKNSDPGAVAVFHTMSLALGILSDPGKRLFLDSRLEKERAQRARYAEMSKKRQAGVDDLLRREEAAKKARADAQVARQAAADEEAVREAGRRMVEEAQRQARKTARAAAVAEPGGSSSASAAAAPAAAGPSARPPAMEPEDLTLRLQVPASAGLDEAAFRAALAKYGAVEHAVFRPAPADAGAAAGGKPGKRKGAVAVVEFARGNWGGCWACWADAERGAGVGGARARWLRGETPAWVAWAEGQAGVPAQPAAAVDADDRSAADRQRQGAQPAANGAGGSSAAAAPGPAPSTTASQPAGTGRSALADLLSRHGASRTPTSAAPAAAAAPGAGVASPFGAGPDAAGAGREETALFRMRQRERARLEAQIRQEEGEA